MRPVLWLCAATLLPLHGPEGQRYWIASGQITTLRSPTTADLRQFARGAHCLIVTTSGKFVAVRETCDAVAQLIR